MSRANDGAQIVRVLDAVQDDVQSAGRRRLVDRRILLRRAERHYTLMVRSVRRAVQAVARLHAHRNAAFPAQRQQFLQACAAGALGDQHTVQRPPGQQRLPNRMDSYKRGHYHKGTS